MLKRGRNRKRHRPLPSPLPHRFLFSLFFVLGSAFARLSLLLYETRNTKENTQQQKNRQLRKLREGIERVQYFESKGNVATMLKQSLQEIKPTGHIKTKSNMRRRQIVSTSTVNNTLKRICITVLNLFDRGFF